jgi:flavin reductase (DIM6/NTAB) family NADH-FMN oxidoreductase RutF
MAWRAWSSRASHPVVIIGAAHGGERSCATGTTMYVSHSLAMLAIAVHPGSRTTRLIRESGDFSVSLLHESQQALASAAGKSAAGFDKFAALNIAVLDPPEDLTAPGVAGSVAVLWCRITASEPTGDHQDGPLLRYRRRYMRSGSWTSEESPEGYPT